MPIMNDYQKMMMMQQGQMPPEREMSPFDIMLAMQQQQQQQGGGMVQRTPDFMPQDGQAPEMDMQQEPPMPRNPLANGAESAMEMIKRSMQMNDEEKSHALGRAFMTFGNVAGQMVPPEGAGLAGNLGRINAGLLPAVDAYDAERKQIQNQNLLIQKMLKEEELDREKMRTQVEHYKAMQDHHKGHLGLQRERLELDKAERNAEVEEANLLNKPGGRIPLSALRSPSNINMVHKALDKNDAAYKAYDDVYQTTSRLKNILSSTPEMLSKLNKISYLVGKDDDGATLRRYLVNQGVKEDDLAKYELAAKDYSRLKVQGVSAFTSSGNRHNMQLDKAIGLMMPGMHLTPKAQMEIVDLMNKESKKAKDAHRKVADAYQEGFFERMHLPKEQEAEESENPAYTSMERKPNPADAYSPEELEMMLEKGEYVN